MKTLKNQEVEITETGFDDGIAQVIEAYYVQSEIALTEDEMLALEEKYQEELLQNHYGDMVDRAHSMMEDR